jgi:predicted nuclease with TOPRIM domain
VEQPKGGDGEQAWRQYAAALRQRLQEANGRAREEAEERYARVQRHARALESRSRERREEYERLEADYARLREAKRRDGARLDRLEFLLREGDVPAAVDLLAERRARIDAQAAYWDQEGHT